MGRESVPRPESFVENFLSRGRKAYSRSHLPRTPKTDVPKKFNLTSYLFDVLYKECKICGMEKFSIVNLNNFTWHLNIALMGGAFAAFSLIYNERYIYYGLITFAFGVAGHVSCKFFDWVFEDNFKSKYYWTQHLFNVFLTIAWITVIICIY